MRDGPGDGLSAEPRVADVADAQRRERPEGARLEHDMALPEHAENCVARCPQQIDIPRMMDYLREESLRAGCVGEKAKPVVAFHRAFLDSVKYTGRLYEVGLIAGFKARTMRLAQDLPLVPDMLAKGKLSLLPEQVKNKKAIRHIFDEAG